MTPEEVEALAVRARRDAEHYLREEWRGARRDVLFGGGGMMIVGVLMGGCVAPTFALSATHSVVGAAVPIGVSLVWTALKLRCPRCDRWPLSGALLVQHRRLLPPGCPHCGLSFEGE